MSRLQRFVERLVARLKNDAGYRIADVYTDRQMASVLWHRGRQRLRGLLLPAVARSVQAPVFRGRRVVIEHGYQLGSGPALILEDDVAINALSHDGIRLGRNVTIARASTLTCIGVLASLGRGIRIGDRSAIGAGCFLGGQGGIVIGDDVIIGAGTRIFSENHLFDDTTLPIRSQGTSRRGVAIASDCWIGASVTVVDGVEIGTGCVVAAGAVVTRSIPPWSVVAGVPARIIRSRRADEPPDHVHPTGLPAAMDTQARSPMSRETRSAG